MNRKKLIAIVVLVLLLGAGAWFLMRDDTNDSAANRNNANDNPTTTTQTEEQSDAKEQASFDSISSGGKAQQCSFTYSSDAGSGKGNMYADGKGRGRMTINLTTSQGTAGETNTLVTSDKAYTWFQSGDQAMGFVYSKASFDKQASSGSTTSPAGTSPDQKFKMDCDDWKVDEALLTPPKSVKFTSIPTTTQ